MLVLLVSIHGHWRCDPTHLADSVANGGVEKSGLNIEWVSMVVVRHREEIKGVRNHVDVHVHL